MEELPQAPYHRREKCDPNEQGNVYAHLGGGGGTAIGRKSKSLKLDWRKRLSISRVVFGRKEARVVRLSDSGVGFGQRKSPAPGAPQKLTFNRKKEQPVVMTPTPAGTACLANEIVSRKMYTSRAIRQIIREMVKVVVKEELPSGPPQKAMPRSGSAAGYKLAPPESSSKVRSASIKAASASGVVEFASERECLERRVGGREQKTFDEIFDWKLVQLRDGSNVALLAARSSDVCRIPTTGLLE